MTSTFSCDIARPVSRRLATPAAPRQCLDCSKSEYVNSEAALDPLTSRGKIRKRASASLRQLDGDTPPFGPPGCGANSEGAPSNGWPHDYLSPPLPGRGGDPRRSGPARQQRCHTAGVPWVWIQGRGHRPTLLGLQLPLLIASSNVLLRHRLLPQPHSLEGSDSGVLKLDVVLAGELRRLGPTLEPRLLKDRRHLGI